MGLNQFPDYQSLEEGSEGAPAKANRSIPDRIEQYELMKYVKGKSVLDLGCNRGYFGTVLMPHLKSYLGIDSDADQTKHAQNTNLLTRDFACLELTFDVIFCFAFHSYVDMPMKDFAKCLDKMLNKGGYLFLEGHPAGYREEPQKYLEPLRENLTFKLIKEKKVKDRELLRPFYIYKK